MLHSAHNIATARRWQEKRRRIRAASGAGRLRLLRSFGEEIRALPPAPGRNAGIGADAAPLFAAVLGAWLSLDPSNPDWPGRDRLYLTDRGDLAAACAVLSVCGFFPPERLPEIAGYIDASGRDAAVPGIESPGIPVQEIPPLLWESATASARDKKRWREMFGQGGQGGGQGRGSWFSPEWRAAQETWRSCVVLDAEDAVADACRDLARRRDEAAAGLAALVKAPESSAHDIIEAWADAGWRAVLVNGGDILQLHDVLAGAKLDAPLAVVLTIPGREPRKADATKVIPKPFSVRTAARRHESGLLGELSDEQFSALFDESLKQSEGEG